MVRPRVPTFAVELLLGAVAINTHKEQQFSFSFQRRNERVESVDSKKEGKIVKINGGNFYFYFDEIVGLIFLGREKFEGKMGGNWFYEVRTLCLTACERWVSVLKKLGVCEFGG